MNFTKILRFFQLADRAGNLSITNIAVIVLITKIALAATLDWGVISGLLIALLNYGHKRSESNKAASKEAELLKDKELQDAITAINVQVEAISSKQANQDSINSELIKVSEDTKSALSKANLQNAFTPAFKRGDR